MRIITFSLPTYPGLVITARETGAGTLQMDFDLPDRSPASLQGIYFNFLDGTDIVVTGSHITSQARPVVTKSGPSTPIDGAKGLTDGFDLALGIGNAGRGKGVVTDTTITLASADGSPLTLDVLSHQSLGVRLQNVDLAKHVMTMPAAPDAIDDVVDAVEDETATFNVTSNDTDADGNPLTIVAVDDPLHGAVAIEDNKIVYIADEHWSGKESFTYQVKDGTGGFDTATITVDVEAVADAPTLSAEVSAGKDVNGVVDVNEVVVDISSALVDLDGSESYALKVSGLPDGVTLVGATDGMILNPDGSDQIKLQLAPGASFNFDLLIEAISTEASNDDKAVSSTTIEVAVDHAVFEGQVAFDAENQSQWTSGEQFVFDDERFLGIDKEGNARGSDDHDIFYGAAKWDVRVGLESDLHFEGGEVDATVPWDLSVDSTLNRTTDVLELDTSAVLADGGGFRTDGPELQYMLDFIFDVYVAWEAGVIVAGKDDRWFGDEIDHEASANLINFDSETSPSLSVPLPYGITTTFSWPNLEVDGSQTSLGNYTGTGESNNVLDVNIDLDEMLTKVLKLPENPFDITVGTEDLLYATFSLLDLDVSAGLNFLQEFALAAGTLDAEIVFENEERQAFTFGDDLVFNDASKFDANGDGDIGFYLDMDLVDSTFSNDTDLGLNAGWNFDALSGSGGIGELKGEFGPVLNLGDSYPVASIDVYDNAFELDFGKEKFEFMV